MALEFEHTDRVLAETRVFHPRREVAEGANITAYMRQKGFRSWDELYRWTIQHLEEFWEEQAKELYWHRPWTKVREWNPPYVKWFLDAQCNIVYNALDRHMGTPVQDKVAFYWEAEDGATRTVSYRELYAEVNRFANALKSLGITRATGW